MVNEIAEIDLRIRVVLAPYLRRPRTAINGDIGRASSGREIDQAGLRLSCFANTDEAGNSGETSRREEFETFVHNIFERHEWKKQNHSPPRLK